MIPDSADAATQSIGVEPDWKQSLAQAISDPQALLTQLQLTTDADTLAAAVRAAKRFKLRVPQGFVARMRRGDWDDPLLRQVLPLGAELDQAPGYSADPVNDLGAIVETGLLHKYAGRALLLTTGACAIHCRYCFRREFPYQDNNPKRDQWQQALEHIAADNSIQELILSGGDPLTLDNRVLEDLIQRCQAIGHLQRLRFHSRLPIVLPERIDQNLCEMLSQSQLQIIQVIHCNHAQEIDEPVSKAISRLRQCSSLVLNQAVLLNGVNDTSASQIQLSEALTKNGVLPYYLHMLDPVRGSHHFAVPVRQAKRIMQDIREALPGYMVPSLVREIPGRASKTPVYEPGVAILQAATQRSLKIANNGN